MLRFLSFFSFKEEKNDQVVIFLGFSVINIISVFLLNHFFKPFGYEYETIARNLLSGFGYSGRFILTPNMEPTSFMAPIYPYLLYLNFKFFGPSNYLPIQIMQALLFAFVPVIAYSVWRKLFKSRKVALLAAFLLVINYPFTFFSGYIGVPVLLSLGTITLVLLFTKIRETPNLLNFLYIGLVSGVFLLLDPIIFMTLFCGILSLFFFLKPKWKISYVIFSLIFTLIIASPWLIRNYKTFGKFPVIKSTFGLNLLEGNNPVATGGIYTNDGLHITKEVWKYVPDSIKEKFKTVNEVERSSLCQSVAMNYIKKMLKENPWGFIKLKLRAYLYFWFGQSWEMRYDIVLKKLGYDSKEAVFFRLTFISSFFLLLTALLGILALKRPLTLNWLPAILFILYPIPYIITKGHSFTRFRMVLDPLLVGYSSFFLYSIWNRFKKPSY